MVSTLSQGMTNRRRLLSKSPESIQVYWCLERGENRSALSRDDKSSQGTAKVAHIHSSLSVPREREMADTLSQRAIQFQQAIAKVVLLYSAVYSPPPP